MSTLFNSRSLAAPQVAQRFHYPAIVTAETISRQQALCSQPRSSKPAEPAIGEELATAVMKAREEGFQAGKSQTEAAMAMAIERERSHMLAVVAQFGEQKADYFRHLEKQAVQLALSIARKILHRESRIDPLLLAGAVKVALEQMQDGAKIVLRTSPSSAAAWTQLLSTELKSDHHIEVEADDGLEDGGCTLQAEMGSTELNIDSQMQELESEFLDLLRETKPEKP